MIGHGTGFCLGLEFLLLLLSIIYISLYFETEKNIAPLGNASHVRSWGVDMVSGISTMWMFLASLELRTLEMPYVGRYIVSWILTRLLSLDSPELLKDVILEHCREFLALYSSTLPLN